MCYVYSILGRWSKNTFQMSWKHQLVVCVCPHTFGPEQRSYVDSECWENISIRCFWVHARLWECSQTYQVPTMEESSHIKAIWIRLMQEKTHPQNSLTKVHYLHLRFLKFLVKCDWNWLLPKCQGDQWPRGHQGWPSFTDTAIPPLYVMLFGGHWFTVYQCFNGPI